MLLSRIHFRIDDRHSGRGLRKGVVWLRPEAARQDHRDIDKGFFGTQFDPESSYLVITKTSPGSPRSRAEGVMIVRTPTKIFSPFLIARRTSSSLTKSTGRGAGGAGGDSAIGWAAPAGFAAAAGEGFAAPGASVAVLPPGRSLRNRSTMREISARSGKAATGEGRRGGLDGRGGGTAKATGLETSASG